MGWSLEERRGRIVDAAVQLATDRGIEHLTLRAAADVAGMSWDTARESFDDHADLLRAVSTAVTRLNVPVDDVDLTAVPAGKSFEDRALAVAHGFWDRLTSDRELQLVSFEILVLALRRTALRPLAAGQQEDQRDLAAQVLTEFAERDGVTWDRPVAEVARFVATFLDGLTTSWMIDGDDDAAAAQLELLVRSLALFVEDPS
ncbi:TetR family transcriptional regulator C-terminal domain-containing protein [Sanguibacter sp. 4.1]|uniref:TetR family transcriptional regulator C-terminal domain-containing protein n=1 Tax=Sanguibacter biliveldensis TaxID=3030830 RepID=A0AAF0Z2H5_9MICO|nr:TetR family transcriptional regulator C-terminal domain-containing protein [Sanguibacter sp. 4.1]WPF81803.1 TetR family transcriptional regulator C-terminal domain-containing protein [Sanguibacter sp. 4.1]